jgi:hypothetical protein
MKNNQEKKCFFYLNNGKNHQYERYPDHLNLVKLRAMSLDMA